MTKFNLNLKNLNSTQFWIKQWGVKTEAIFFLNGIDTSSWATRQHRTLPNPINDFITNTPLNISRKNKIENASFTKKLTSDRKGCKYFQFNFLIESQIFPLSIANMWSIEGSNKFSSHCSKLNWTVFNFNWAFVNFYCLCQKFP